MNSKIALFLPSLRGGGAERVMVNLANEFVQRGLSVDLVLANAEGPYLSAVSKGVNVIDLSSPRVLMCLPGLVRYLRGALPDVLISTMAHSNIIAVLATLLAGKKNRVFVRESNTVSVGFSQMPSSRRFIWRSLMHFFYKKATAVIAPSQGVARDLEVEITLAQDSVNVIYNPIVMPELEILANETFTHPWFGSLDTSVILAAGRLTKQKDYPTLIKALKIIREERDVRLIILGEGEERQLLEDIAQKTGVAEYIDMPGFAENPFKFMKSADLFVLSSAWEGLPGTLIQAMACGCQVVSTDCPSGPNEILKNGEYGELVPVGDERRLSVAILKALNDANSKPDVLQRSAFFNVGASVDAYLALIGV